MPALIRSIIFIVAGVLSAGFGIKGFLVPSGFIDGGVTGVSMLLAHVTVLPLPFYLILLNIPFLFLGYRSIGYGFAIRSAMGILALAMALLLIDYPNVTDDKLLAAVFGGFFLGAGIGLSVRGGGVLDGTEIMALIVGKRFGWTIGDIIIAVNVMIFSTAAVILGIETALYSILTYFSASKTIDYLIHGLEEYQGVIVVSPQSQQIRRSILQSMNRGMTIYKGYGGQSHVEYDILFCVVTRLEIPKIKAMIRAIDETAFVVIHPISDASGGVMKRTVLDEATTVEES